MSRTLTISDILYERLEREARARGLDTIEQLLEERQHDDHDLAGRRAAVLKIDELRAEVHERYGTLPDSTELQREDRER